MAEMFKARVAENKALASKFHNLHLELVAPDRISFEAGQYVMVKIPEVEGMKQYSIASAPSMDHGVELLVDVAPQGPGSKYLQALRPGDEVEFMAPAGKFVVDKSGVEQELWFVATGSGISSIKSIIVDLLVDKRDTRPMWLHWGLRCPEDVFWFSDFAQLSEEHDNFTFDPVLSKPSSGWKFCSGHTIGCLVRHHQNFSQAGVYLCGCKEMIEEGLKVLQEKGVPGTNVHHEQFC